MPGPLPAASAQARQQTSKRFFSGGVSSLAYGDDGTRAAAPPDDVQEIGQRLLAVGCRAGGRRKSAGASPPTARCPLSLQASFERVECAASACCRQEGSCGSCPWASRLTGATTSAAPRVRPVRQRTAGLRPILLKGPGSPGAESPSSCKVFQGVPRPASSAAGHCVWLSATWISPPPQRRPDAQRPPAGVVQHCAPSCATSPVERRAQPPVHPRWQGDGIGASRAPGQDSCAEPFQTVPLASASSKWPSVAFSMAPASHRAGANSTRADTSPSSGAEQSPGPRLLAAGGQERGVPQRVRAASARRQGQHQRAFPQPG